MSLLQKGNSSSEVGRPHCKSINLQVVIPKYERFKRKSGASTQFNLLKQTFFSGVKSYNTILVVYSFNLFDANFSNQGLLKQKKEVPKSSYK
jgi:hypothetical protein